MNGLPNVKEVRSISQFGLSAVTVEFDEGTNIYFARQIVSQRIRSVADELPEGVSTPQLGPISTALGEIYQYVVKGDGYSLTELRTIQDWLIAPQLKIVRGVTEINSFGGFVKQYEIRVLPGKLRAYQLGLDDVLDAAAENNGVAGGNYLEHNREQYIVRGFGQITNARDIEQIIVKKYDDRPRLYARRRRRNRRQATPTRRRHERRQGRGRHGHRDDAPRRQRQRRYRRRRGENRRGQQELARRRDDREILRPIRSRRSDDQHGHGQPGRGRLLRRRRAPPVARGNPRRDYRRARHPPSRCSSRSSGCTSSDWRRT